MGTGILDATSRADVKRKSRIEVKKLDEIESEFLPLLVSCLQECAQGRWGLFGQNDHLDEARWLDWPEARRLKQLAKAINLIRAQTGHSSDICNRFLGLCSLRGPNVEGELRLAARLLAEIAQA